MKEVFRLGKIFIGTKKGCLKKGVEALESFILEKYNALEKSNGWEFIFELTRQQAAIAACMQRLFLIKDISPSRLEKFLNEKVGVERDKRNYDKLGAELAAVGLPWKQEQFKKFLLNVDQNWDRANQRLKRGGRKPRTKIKRRRRRRI